MTVIGRLYAMLADHPRYHSVLRHPEDPLVVIVRRTSGPRLLRLTEMDGITICEEVVELSAP